MEAMIIAVQTRPLPGVQKWCRKQTELRNATPTHTAFQYRHANGQYKLSNMVDSFQAPIVIMMSAEITQQLQRDFEDVFIGVGCFDGIFVSHSSLVVSKHGLYVGGPGSIPTAATTRTAAGGDAECVSLNHWLAPPYQVVKLVPAKCREDSYRRWPWVGCKWLLSHHLKVMAHTKVGWVPCWELKCKVVR